MYDTASFAVLTESRWGYTFTVISVSFLVASFDPFLSRYKSGRASLVWRLGGLSVGGFVRFALLVFLSGPLF